MAAAAQAAVAHGADVVDINMGCPAKKVLNRQAGSALLRDPPLVEAILRAVVAAVDVPVTLKMRTGWDAAQRNGVDIARRAEDACIAALAVHGRTRACGYGGAAEYDFDSDVVDERWVPGVHAQTPEMFAEWCLAEGMADSLLYKGIQTADTIKSKS